VINYYQDVNIFNNGGNKMNHQIEAIKRVIAKRVARGANEQHIQAYKESIAKNIKHDKLRQLILKL
jgi:hypothetical protein